MYSILAGKKLRSSSILASTALAVERVGLAKAP